MRKSFTGSGALKLALNNGVDPNAKIKTFNIDERNLIFLAIKTGVPEIVKLFLEADADLSVTYENKTPLDFARSLKNPEIIKLLESVRE